MHKSQYSIDFISNSITLKGNSFIFSKLSNVEKSSFIVMSNLNQVSQNKNSIDSKWQTFLNIEYGITIPPSFPREKDRGLVNCEWGSEWVKEFNLPQKLLIQFSTATFQSIICTSFTVWFVSATKQDRNSLQKKISAAEKTVGANQPPIQDLYMYRLRKWAGNISAETKNCSLKKTDSFFPQDITLMNT